MAVSGEVDELSVPRASARAERIFPVPRRQYHGREPVVPIYVVAAALTAVKVARLAAHGLTPAVLAGVELDRFVAHGLTPAVLMTG